MMLFLSVVKGIYYPYGAAGQFVADDTASARGVNGISVGDGFHNYLIAGFVSCNHSTTLPAGHTVQSARLSLRTSRVFGFNPFYTGSGISMALDMVGVRALALPAVPRLHALVYVWDVWPKHLLLTAVLLAILMRIFPRAAAVVLQDRAFGGSPLLQIVDFQAPAAVTGAGSVTHDITIRPASISFDLTPTAIAFLEAYPGLVQFRLRAVNTTGFAYTNYNDKCVSVGGGGGVPFMRCTCVPSPNI